MSINKKHLALRIIAYPVKLLFNLAWFNFLAVALSFKWIKNGGQELYYGPEHEAGLVKVLESNEKLIEELKNISKETKRVGDLQEKNNKAYGIR